MLYPIRAKKIIYHGCFRIYNPRYELVKVQDSETTIDELLSQGELSYHDDNTKDSGIRKTVDHAPVRLEDLEYAAREFERYHEIKIIDIDTITRLNKTRNRRPKQLD